ncbi:MAG TPA: ABC transporter permease [Verrucomicrobiae bacterium]|jgi:putative ABC transport system permease protein|nr:ABC transporter permease [Verrucomicrobiae bacterium]
MKAIRILLGEIKESFLMALGAIVAHKLRSALTLLGVLVGVFSIIIVMTSMRAMQQKIEADLNRLGGQTFVIKTWPTLHFEGNRSDQSYWRRKRIDLVQGAELMRRATLPLSIGIEDNGLTQGQIISRYAKSSPNIPLNGETPGSFPAKNWNIAQGRALLQADVDGLRDTCVLGSTLADDLFPFSSPLGEKVELDGVKYTVVGVLEANGGMEGSQQDEFAIIPVTTGINRYEDKRWLNLNLLVQARNAASYDETVEQVRGIMRQVRKVGPGKPDDFEINSNDSLIEQMKSFTYKVRLGISLISSIALIAAGIGIMNIMLVSVTERTREIGIRRAIGAKKRTIMAQFILEAVVLCEVGGVAGVALGVGGGDLIAILLHLPKVLPVDWIVIGLTICSLVGIIFGTYPAYKAAHLDPIESLRYE